MLSQTLQETLRGRLEDGQRENLAMEVQRYIAAQLLGKIFQDLSDHVCRCFVVG